MNDNIIKATLIGLGTVVTGVVTGVVVNAIAKTAQKSIETNNKKDREELERQIQEFEVRKEKAARLEQHTEKKLSSMREEIRSLEKLKGELEDSSNIVTVMASVMGELKEIKNEVNRLRYN